MDFNKYYLGKDSWFDREWADKITNDFAIWWEKFYGLPEDFSESVLGCDYVHEYFVRMAFAFMGWQARNK